MQPGYGQPTAGERWNVNMPAVIGVVFVFLIGVIVWVVATADDDGEASGAASSTLVPSSTVAPAAPVATVTSDPAPTTTPPPLPTTVPLTDATTTTTSSTTTTVAPTSTAPTTSTTVAPATTAPGADPDAVPGDLAIDGRPMRRPSCDGGYITIVASAIGDQATPEGIEAVLDDYSGSNYLRTDQTCSSLNASVDGQPIYVVYFGPFGGDDTACDARSDGPEGSYVRQLSNDVSPDHSVTCPSPG